MAANSTNNLVKDIDVETLEEENESDEISSTSSSGGMKFLVFIINSWLPVEKWKCGEIFNPITFCLVESCEIIWQASVVFPEFLPDPDTNK